MRHMPDLAKQQGMFPLLFPMYMGYACRLWVTNLLVGSAHPTRLHQIAEGLGEIIGGLRRVRSSFPISWIIMES